MRRSRKRKKQRKIIILSMICLLCMMTAGYAAFQTNLNISAKGNIKDIKKEVDAKVPTNDLLFWGQTDNKENTSSILNDKSSNNNAILHGFDNTVTSGYNGGILEFDGIDDYVDIGYANYDFKNSISYVMYLKVNSVIGNSDPAFNYNSLFGNWEGNGSGVLIYGNGNFGIEIYDGTKWITGDIGSTVDTSKYYTIIATYNGSNFILYVDGMEKLRLASSKHTVSIMPILIGANPNAKEVLRYSNISLREAMLYDRALTEDEVKSITSGFEKKYK